VLLGPLPPGPAPVPPRCRPRGLGGSRPPLRLAYADPPYSGKAGLRRNHPDYGGEVDHAALIARLAGYEGWALSTSTDAVPAVLALCPPSIRVAAWHRGERPTRSRWPLHAWEPVIYSGGRLLITGTRRADSIGCGVAPLDTLPGWVIGAKPAAVCQWIFTLLGAAPGDTLDDCSRAPVRWAEALHDASSPAAHDRLAPRRPGPDHHQRTVAGAPGRVLSCSDPSPEPDRCQTW